MGHYNKIDITYLHNCHSFKKSETLKFLLLIWRITVNLLPNHDSSSAAYEDDRFTVTHVHCSFNRAQDYSRVPTLLNSNRPVKYTQKSNQ